MDSGFGGQVVGDLAHEQVDQGRGHEGVGVGDVEADDALAVDVGAVFFGEAAALGFFHHEDEVGPFDEFAGDGVVRFVAEPGRGAFNAWIGGEELLGGGASELVFTANEKNVQHLFRKDG